MKRPEVKERDPSRVVPFPDESWTKKWPLLCEHLAADCYDDGTPRQPSLLSIKEQDGLVLASLTDKDLERGLYRTGRDVSSALSALEKALDGGTADWRPWQAKRSPGKSRG